MSARVELGRGLSLAELVAVARRDAPVDLGPEARARVERSWRRLQGFVAEGLEIYGLTSGFGALDGRPTPPEQNEAQQRGLLRSHAAGLGPSMPRDATRAMMALRADLLARGLSGVRPATLDALVAMLNRGVTPEIPLRGSVGAADLAPLAHMALPLIGLGRARVGDGPPRPGAEALAAVDLAPPGVAGRDAIALIGGGEQALAIGCLAVEDAATFTARAEAVAALSLEAFGAVSDSFDDKIARWKGHPGQIETSARLRALTAGSANVRPPRPGRLRDTLSLRCVPQVLGALRDAVSRSARVLEIERAGVADNPVFDPEDGYVTSNSGNFHGEPVAQTLDNLADAVVSVAGMSELRCARLVDHGHNGGLPAFLIHPEAMPGREHGFMIAQYTAAALIAEMRTRAVPASIQSLPVCANTEDHASMAPLAARRAASMIALAEQVIAIEALLAAQAVDLRGAPPAPGLRSLHASIRAAVPVMVEDRVLSEDIAAVHAALARWEAPEFVEPMEET
jgi:histidine ammonia-lyase